jgi:hypothetical protein
LTTWRRLLVFVLGVLVCGQAVALCGLTGWRALTRFPSEEFARVSNDGALSSLFDEAGLNEGRAKMDRITSEFAFGWFPSPTLGREALSVVSVGGPGLLLALLAVLPSRKRRR